MASINSKKLNIAFTLVELLVVIAIIGILSGLIIVGMSSTTQSATIAKSQVFSSSLRDSLLMNLVSEWRFDGSGVTDGGTATSSYLQDTWGTNSSGSINGTPLIRSGSNCVNGSCLEFNAVADYITVGNSITVDLSGGYTVEGWAKFRSLPNGTSVDSIMLRRDSDATGWFIFCYRNTGDATNYVLSYVEYTNTSNVTQSMGPGTIIEANKWQYITLSVESNGTAKFYVNGVVKSTSTPVNFLKLGGVSATNTSAIYLAHTGWGTGFNGWLDTVRLYNASIPSSQIKDHYFAGLNRLFTNGGISKEDYQSRLSSFLALN